jgi:hypothetical protein
MQQKLQHNSSWWIIFTTYLYNYVSCVRLSSLALIFLAIYFYDQLNFLQIEIVWKWHGELNKGMSTGLGRH